MRLRWCVLATALVLGVTACGGGSSGKAVDAAATASAARPRRRRGRRPGKCDTPLTSPEVGVTPTTITVTVIADVNNSLRPGLFKGSWDGVKAWGDYINANGGLACRKVVVKAGRLEAEPDRRRRTRSPPRAATRSRWSARPRCSSQREPA